MGTNWNFLESEISLVLGCRVAKVQSQLFEEDKSEDGVRGKTGPRRNESLEESHWSQFSSEHETVEDSLKPEPDFVTDLYSLALNSPGAAFIILVFITSNGWVITVATLA